MVSPQLTRNCGSPVKREIPMHRSKNWTAAQLRDIFRDTRRANYRQSRPKKLERDRRGPNFSVATFAGIPYIFWLRMNEQCPPKLAKWPFFLGDVLLVAVSAVIVYRQTLPLDLASTLEVIACVVI